MNPKIWQFILEIIDIDILALMFCIANIKSKLYENKYFFSWKINRTINKKNNLKSNDFKS